MSRLKASKLKIAFSLFWLVLTFSMVSWWFIVALNVNTLTTAEGIQRHQRMIRWEGTTLLTAIFVGGFYLIFYVYRDAERHERLKFFFSNFSHDIKTSIARIKLQTEILAEQSENKSVARLLEDLSRLDLQLENSLLLTHLDDAMMLNEKLSLKSLVESISIEFEHLQISISQDAEIFVDSRAIRSIFRNLLENSLRHGKATQVEFLIKQSSANLVSIDISDNGSGSQIEVEKIGSGILPYRENASNGIGLFLAKKLIRKMHGQIFFQNRQSSGFTAHIELTGQLIKGTL